MKRSDRIAALLARFAREGRPAHFLAYAPLALNALPTTHLRLIDEIYERPDGCGVEDVHLKGQRARYNALQDCVGSGLAVHRAPGPLRPDEPSRTHAPATPAEYDRAHAAYLRPVVRDLLARLGPPFSYAFPRLQRDVLPVGELQSVLTALGPVLADLRRLAPDNSDIQMYDRAMESLSAHERARILSGLTASAASTVNADPG